MINPIIADIEDYTPRTPKMSTDFVHEDLVARLRREGDDAMTKHLSVGMWRLCQDAAVALCGQFAEISRLHREIDKLTAANSRREIEISKLTIRLHQAQEKIKGLGEGR